MNPILFLVLGLLFALAPGNGQSPPPHSEPRIEVRVGSGEVAPLLLERIREQAENGLGELAPLFPGLSPGPFAVFVHGSSDDLPPALAAVRHPGAPGFALLGRHQIHLVIGDLRRTESSLGSVVRHELVHELLDQFASPYGGAIPRWFHEGLAQFLAKDTYLGAREQDLVWRVGVRRMLSFRELRRGFPRDAEDLRAAYAQSYSYVSWLVRQYGLDELMRVIGMVDDDTTLDQALVYRLHRSTLELHDAWIDYLLYGSGAWWRILLDQCFNALLFLALPALGIAWWRRRHRSRILGERMERRAAMFPHEFDLERRELELDEEEELDAEKPAADDVRPG